MSATPKRARSAARRLGVGAVALALAAGLGACGEKDEPDLSTLPDPTATVAEPAPTATEVTPTTPPATPLPTTPAAP